MKVKEKFNVWFKEPDANDCKRLLALLEDYGIPYKQGYEERVPHPKERFVIPAIDYAVSWVVRFRVPKALRTDPTFVQQLDKLVPLGDEDFEE